MPLATANVCFLGALLPHLFIVGAAAPDLERRFQRIVSCVAQQPPFDVMASREDHQATGAMLPPATNLTVA